MMFWTRKGKMAKTKRLLLVVLVTVLLGVGVFAGSFIYADTVNDTDIEVTEHSTSSDTAGNVDDAGKVLGDQRESKHARLSQRVTVVDDTGLLPYSGTITKLQDAFYPGTYKLNFSSNAILTETVTVVIDIDVKQGEEVYILTGDKDTGYREYAVVTTAEPNRVEFTTSILQNYTLSTTDICSAQEAMADIVGDY